MAYNIKSVRHPKSGGNRFCGPAALSILTGIDTGQAAALLREVSGARAIMGTYSSHMIKALVKLGYSINSAYSFWEKPTLAAWLRDTRKDRGTGVYLVSAGHHWQVVQGRRYCCGIVGDVISIRDDRVKRRARVRAAYEVVRITSVKIEEVVPKKRTEDPSVAKARREAKRIAEEHGIEIETERYADGDVRIVVWGPDWPEGHHSEDTDPYAGDHYACGWQDALDMVKTYRQFMLDNPAIFRPGLVGADV